MNQEIKNEEIRTKNKNSGLFFGIVGVMTMIIALIGGTYAYFAATNNAGNNVIKGNAAKISFTLSVTKDTTADDDHGGLIPLTNGMASPAVTNKCVDDNSNAVCQIYKITITNTGTASMFLDGYINLTGGAPSGTSTSPTNMRWAQVFASGSGSSKTYSVSGTPSLAPGATNISAISLTATGTSNVNLTSTQSTSTYTFNGNTYTYINNNYMRTSGHSGTEYSRTDVNNTLVLNQYLAPASDSTNSTKDLYFVVWLSETGTDQTITSGKTNNFFNGYIVFNSSEGEEISAVFSGYTTKEA